MSSYRDNILLSCLDSLLGGDQLVVSLLDNCGLHCSTISGGLIKLLTQSKNEKKKNIITHSKILFCQSLPELQLNTLHGSLSGHGPLSPTLSDCHDGGAGHSGLPQHEPHIKFLQHILIVLLRGTSVLSWNKLYEQIVILLQFYFTCHLNHGGRLQSFSVEDVI